MGFRFGRFYQIEATHRVNASDLRCLPQFEVRCDRQLSYVSEIEEQYAACGIPLGRSIAQIACNSVYWSISSTISLSKLPIIHLKCR
ncbi:MAG: hypothetical protein KY448_16875, partial [Cyanobacteria bacterium 0813]|nr:hypothetical protein [Cyanobacteria bacterium 0813]